MTRSRALPPAVALRIAVMVRESGAEAAHRRASNEISLAITFRQVRDLARRYKDGYTCSDCSVPITSDSATGRCKPCASRQTRKDPVFEQRRIAGLRRTFGTPEYRAAKSLERQAYEATRKDDPAWQAYKRASGKRLRADFEADPEAQAKSLAKRSAVGRLMTDRLLAWCPEDRRDDYRRLSKKVGRVEARRMIEAEMTPFERQLSRLRAGARLVAKPDTRPTSPAYSLVGNATGML